MINEKELNIEIFDLVNLVSSKSFLDKSYKNKNDNYIGDNEIARFEKPESLISSIKDKDGNIIESYKDSLGLKKNSYKKLRNITDKIIELYPYSEFTSIRFIEKILFEWIIDAYLNKKTEVEPLTYLKQCYEKDINNYNFYFKLESFRIQKPFRIGAVEFTFFDDNFLSIQLEKFKREFPNKSEKEFKLFFKEFISIPIVKITSKGIRDKAEQNAKKSINISIDALKCFLVIESINLKYKLPDVEYRFSKTNNLFIYDTVSDKFDYQLKFDNEAMPISIDSKKLQELNKLGLGIVSDFISNKRNNELYNKIIEMISSIAEYSSERNLHERIVKIVSTYESIFIPQSPTRGGRPKGLTLIKQVLDKILDQSDEEQIKRIFIGFDKIRNSYLHNRIPKFIDVNDLIVAQSIMILLLIELIQLNEKLKTLGELLDHFEIKQ